ncbi:MAG: sugar ABC transporter permease [Chloroflexi bacterium]|nr:sugar ABC transporter permease [Chloroflexota bacterium]MCY3583877.1 sugar ABC transporter permease [Chloroflexota bacterium]MCY3715127.1 sugar ABC transporter permease [Chloroflexota bacterium]MDE2651575.1 sugar ABC transporter permease [Chloroflexota bacterium]
MNAAITRPGADHWRARFQNWWFQHRSWIGFLFILPWFAGFIIFDLMPFVYNLYLSFTDYQIGTQGTPPWLGLENYLEIFTEDKLFSKSMYNTVYYLGFSVPLRLAFAFLIALLLNMRVRGMELYRTLFYVPSVVPLIAATLIFAGLLNTRYGLFNHVFVLVGLPPVRWLSSPDWIKPSLIILSLWGFGAQMIIFLAGLQGIPKDLYEAVAIDGGGSWRRLRHITLPLMTPTIFFNLLIGVIGGFQVFAQVFVMVGVDGGPLGAGLVYMIHVYNKAFRDFEFGYAAALSVILFSIIFVLTIALVYTSNRWVFYGDGGEDAT